MLIGTEIVRKKMLLGLKSYEEYFKNGVETVKFDGVFDFINNEDDFLNFVAMYKRGEIEGDNLIIFKKELIRSNYNYSLFKTNKNSVDEFRKTNSNIENIEIDEDGFIERVLIKIDVDKIENMILQYKKEMELSISNKNCKSVFLNFACFKTFKNRKECIVPIDEYIYNYITHKECLRLYLFFIYYSQRLENDINSFRISQKDISIVLEINENKVREYINMLINNNLIERIRVSYKKSFYYEYRIIPYEEFIQNKNDVFIYDSFNKDKNLFKAKKTEIKIEKDESMINIPSMYYIVYEITDLTNGMKYIGKHKTYNINDGYMGSGRLLKQNQEIKGIENFTKKILHLCKNEQHMNEMERLEIEKVKAYENNDYYNIIKRYKEWII